MIICNSKRFIYIHLQKTAGTSIERALGPHLKWNDVILGSTAFGERTQGAYREQYGLDKHSSAQSCYDTVGNGIWSDYYSFATVRNPYSLVVSGFTYAGRMLAGVVSNGTYNAEHIGALRRAGAMSAGQLLSPRVIKKFLKAGFNRSVHPSRVLNWALVQGYLESAGVFDDYLRRPITWTATAMMPQFDRLAIDVDGEKAITLDSVLRMEALAESWPVVCAKLGVDAQLPHDNVSAAGRWQDYYRSQENRALVEERFKKDFDYFGYPRLEV